MNDEQGERTMLPDLYKEENDYKKYVKPFLFLIGKDFYIMSVQIICCKFEN